MSPARKGLRVVMCTAPSICGESPLVRPFASRAPPSSTMASRRLPTLAASFFALIACARAMKRLWRLALISSGTGSRPRSLAAAPLTGSYWNAPTRSSLASSSQSSRKRKSSSVSPGKPTMKVERMVKSGQIERHARMRSSVFSWVAGRSMLERHVDIGQHVAAIHERNRLVDMRIGVDILQPDPGAERTQFARDVEKARGDLPVAPTALGVFKVEAIGARVLRDDNELLDARLHEPL